MTTVPVSLARGRAVGRLPLASRRSFLVGLGVLLAVLVVVGVWLILDSFRGDFTDFVPATVELPASSTAVQPDSPVEYRNVTVGKVISHGTQIGGGMVAVTVHLRPGRISALPTNVRATVAPVSIFGNEYVVLVPPATPASTTLRSHAVIAPLQTDATASLQNTLGDLDHLLIQLDPAQLDTALTAVANALQGQGAGIGQTLVRGNTYLQALIPQWPTLVKDLAELNPVANTIAGATPNLVATLDNGVAPSSTVTAAGPQIAALFGGGATLSTQASNLLGDIQQPFSVLTAASGPFLDDIGENPAEIKELLSGLSTWASTWSQAEADGPYLKLTATVDVLNPADLGLALLGGPLTTQDLTGGLGAALVNPPTYTSAKTPPLTADTSLSSDTAGTAGGEMAEPQQQDAVSKIVTAATGRAPSSPAVATLMLSPVLAHVVSP